MLRLVLSSWYCSDIAGYVYILPNIKLFISVFVPHENNKKGQKDGQRNAGVELGPPNRKGLSVFSSSIKQLIFKFRLQPHKDR